MSLGAQRAAAADVQTQTLPLTVSTSCSSLMSTSYNGVDQHPSNVSTSSSSSSPTKIHHVNNCNVAERGVPEGAASAPNHDFSSHTQANANNSTFPNSNVYLNYGTNNITMPNSQNSVYYAMNV